MSIVNRKSTTMFLLLIVVALCAGILHWSSVQAAEKSPEGAHQLTYLPVMFQKEEEGIGIPPNCRFLEEQGIVIMEVESIPAGPQWAWETDVSGYLGQSYITWRGPQYFGQPGVATISYPIRIGAAGDYLLRIRNFHNYPGRPDLENDVWVRMDDGPWIKLYSATPDVWTWASWFEVGPGQHAEPRYFLDPGDHMFEMSARSYGFRMDRIALFQPGTDGQNDSLPESLCVLPLE